MAKTLAEVFAEADGDRDMGSYAMLGAGWSGNAGGGGALTQTITTGSTMPPGSTVVYYPTTTGAWWSYGPMDVTPPTPVEATPVPWAPWPLVLPAPDEVAPPPARLDDFMVERGGPRLIELD